MIRQFIFCALIAAAARAGQQDFDFNFGTWHTHVRRIVDGQWVEGDGTVSVRKIWNGKANLEEIELDSPAGHLEGLTLRLYNPDAHQWALAWANAKSGVLSPPNYGEFAGGRGVFYDQEEIGGKTVVVRQIYSAITNDSYHFEQSFSSDRGRTFQPNFIADLKRVGTQPAAQTVSAPDRNRDFDFNFGTWKTHVSRLLNGKWIAYDGTSNVAPVWNGRASLFELDVKGPAGHIEGMGLRLYNQQTREWSLNWVNSRVNALGVPTIGAFANGRGEFQDQELLDGRAIFVRNGFSDIRADSSHFEQAFSFDGVNTWQKNWIMTFTRGN